MEPGCSSDVPPSVPPEVPKCSAVLVSEQNVSHAKRDVTIAALKSRLFNVTLSAGEPAKTGLNQRSAWKLGAPEIDALLGTAGLELGGVHEIALGLTAPGQSLASVAASARLFGLSLLHRRLQALRSISSHARSAQSSTARVLWCATAADLAEGGQLHAPALVRMGLDPGQFIFVTPPRASDVLWAMEEGLRSNALAAVVGQIDDVGLTPARRLALAAAAACTPCLLIANARAGPVAAVATRWRIGPLPSGPLPSGMLQRRWRMSIGLERCRARPVGSGSVIFAGEWSDDTHCFRVVAGSADRAVAPESGTKDGVRAPEQVG
jgi:protein ImuA